MAGTACGTGDLDIAGAAGLRWYRSSAHAERGFCATCGSSLFWRPDQGNYLGIMAGTLDMPTGLDAISHIHVADAADFVTIGDGLPRHDHDGPAGLRLMS